MTKTIRETVEHIDGLEFGLVEFVSFLHQKLNHNIAASYFDLVLSFDADMGLVINGTRNLTEQEIAAEEQASLKNKKKAELDV